MFKVELSMEEVQTLASLIDIAVKANGIRVAESAVYFIKKLENAVNETNKEMVVE